MSSVSFETLVRELGTDPGSLEQVYRQAIRSGDQVAFAAAMEAAYAAEPDNLLYAAWHYRLAESAQPAIQRSIPWLWVVAAGLLNGLLLWFFSDDQRFQVKPIHPLDPSFGGWVPLIALLAAPVTALCIALFLRGAGGGRWQRVLMATAGLAAAVVYPLVAYRMMVPVLFQTQYLNLMTLSGGVLALAAVGYVVLGRRSDPSARFAFLAKSLEVAVVAGLLGIALGLFTAVTFGLFSVLGIDPPGWVQRLFVAGGGGALAVVAVALAYDPRRSPTEQPFDDGVSRLVATLMRLLLPLSIGVLVVYLAFVPFYWQEPFRSRDALAAANAMLFAVLALLVGVVPVADGGLSERGRRWLRAGVIALAALALVVGVYALAAIVYRTAVGRLTVNRLAFIGWSVVNIAALAALLLYQRRAGSRWLQAVHKAFALATALYVAWAALTLVGLPWVFRGSPTAVPATLPVSVRRLVYELPEPILLMCYGSPHIYALEDGQKRWIRDIPTFEAQGFRWNDVHFLACDDLRAVPDGPPIPPDAGLPPQP
ncbi:MAG: hypothetical protein NZ528_09520 [Caldilineales bacterium]|nr:hypothetical protein [Caldilineales bacterium]MDW8318460.1 hypothetical protein [Anaerolineae bacterium]